jgi:membrane fusion protein, multidrug efflux system
MKSFSLKSRILFIVLAVIISSCGSGDKKAELEKLIKQHDEIAEKIRVLEKEVAASDTSASKNQITVATTPIKAMPFDHFIEIQGKVDGDENVTVTAKTLGIVTDILVKEGDEVSQGQILAQLDASVMLTGLKELDQQMIFVDSLYQKQKRLWDQHIGSEIQFLTAKNNKEALEKKRKTLLEQIDMCKIKSPITGTVEEVPVRIGQSMAPGLPAFRVVNFSRIKVYADVAESYSAKIKKGNPVIIFFPDYNKEVASKVDFSSKYINPVNRTFQIEVRMIPEKGDEFRANMIAVIRINDYHADSAYCVPVNLVQKGLEGQFVFVAVDSNGKKTVHKLPVQTGSIYNGLAEIVSGLKTGDMIITSGYNDLMEGQTIQY